MFQRFTVPAREVVVRAQNEARALGHDSIGSEHILLGLLGEEQGIAASVLAELGVTLDEATASVVELVGRGPEPAATGQMPFRPDAKRVLEDALRESLSLGHDAIGTEHVLLGLVRGRDTFATRVLLVFDADYDTVSAALIRALSGPAEVRHGVEDVALTSPPLSPEVLAELERLRTQRDAAVAESSSREEARALERERRLRWAAVELVRAWQRHTSDPT